MSIEDRFLFVCREVQHEGLPTIYARYCNSLSVSADNLDNDYDELLEIVSMLKGMVVHAYMKEHSYFVDSDDTYRRWKKEI